MRDIRTSGSTRGSELREPSLSVLLYFQRLSSRAGTNKRSNTPSFFPGSPNLATTICRTLHDAGITNAE
jgi:hypothetical protein